MFQLTHSAKSKIAFAILFTILNQVIFPVCVFALTGGPSQPEFSQFQPAGMSEMVDHATGDFSYNVPLFEIGGYPINLSYQSGSTYEDEASWVGLGWSLNPGAINRSMRGLPDDFKGDEVVTKMSMKPSVTFGVSLNVSGEVAGLNIAKKIPLKIGVVYDSNKGLGLSASLNVIKDGFNGDLSYSSSSGFGFSGGFSKEINRTENSIQNLKLSGGYSSRGGLQSVNYGMVTEKNEHKFKIFHQNGSGSLDFQPTVFQLGESPEYVSASGVLSFSTGFQVTVADLKLANISGNYFINKFKTNIHDQPSYGIQYHADGIKDNQAALDYSTENTSMYIKGRPDLPYSIGMTDMFSVSGNGIGGQVSLRTRQADYTRPAKRLDLGGSVEVSLQTAGGPSFNLGGDIGLGGSFTSAGGHNSVENNALAIFGSSQNAIPTTEEEQYWAMSGDIERLDLNYYQNLGSDDPIALAITGEGKLATIQNSFSTNTGASFSNTDLTSNSYGSDLESSKSSFERATLVQSYTNDQARNIPGIQKLVSYASQQSAFNVISNPDIQMINRSETGRRGHHLGACKVTNTDGMTYTYGIPVYSFSQVDRTFAVDKNSSNPAIIPYVSNDIITDVNVRNKGNGNGKNGYYQEIHTPSYATSFLLTSVVSPDYVDKTQNGLSPDDLGSAVKFNYNRAFREFPWRTPANSMHANYQPGALSDIGDNNTDDKASFSAGTKEIWYVQSIESTNMVAVFFTEDRNDAFSWNVNNIGANIGDKQKQKKLKRIEVFSKEVLLADQANAKPLQTIYFEYDATGIGTGLPNCQSGKLLLKRVYTKYQSNDTEYQIYAFDYAYPKLPTTGALIPYQFGLSDRWGSYASDLANPAINTLHPTRTNYPYTFQRIEEEKNARDIDAAAFQLTRIALPTGATIDVKYESDRYQYVQDRKASLMYDIAGFWSGEQIEDLNDNANDYLEVLPSDNKLYSFDKNYEYMVVKVPNDTEISNSTTVADLQKLFFADNSNEVYVKTLCHLRDLNGVSREEYVQGYLDIDRTSLRAMVAPNGLKKYVIMKLVVVKNDLKPTVTSLIDYHPISYLAYQQMRLEHPYLIYPTAADLGSSQDPAGGQVVAGIKSLLISGMQDLMSVAAGFEDFCRMRLFADRIDLNHSVARLSLTGKAKFGGGIRVQSVTMINNWYQGQNADSDGTDVLVRSYNYDLEDGTSSGVATWEPGLGRDENCHVSVVPYEQKIKLAPNNTYYSEKPYVESLYPGSAVNYSRVKVTDYDNIVAAEAKSLGYTEYIYYTAKDFPTIVRNTIIERKPFSGSLNIIPLESSVEFKQELVSQGYSVITNSFSGTIKEENVYNRENQLISGKKYYYNTKNFDATNPKDIDPTNVENSVMLLGEDLKAGFGVIHKKMFLWQDFTKHADRSADLDLHFQFEIPAPASPAPIPFVFVPTGAKYNETVFKSSTTVKHIDYSPILRAVSVLDKGSKLLTENLLWDGVTGEVLLTRTQNEYNGWIYNLSIPAQQYYKKMGASYKTSDRCYKISIAQNNVMTVEEPNPAYYPTLEPGDEVVFVDENRVPRSTILHVVSVNLSGAPKNVLMFSNGMPFSFGMLHNSGQNVMVVRSHKRNISGAKMMSVVTLKNPLTYENGIGMYKLNMDNLIDKGVLDASATEFSDKWLMHGKYYKGDCEISETDLLSNACLPPSSGNGIEAYLINGFFESFQGQDFDISMPELLANGGMPNNQIAGATWFDGAPITEELIAHFDYPSFTGQETIKNNYVINIGDCAMYISHNLPFSLSDLVYIQNFGILNTSVLPDNSLHSGYRVDLFCNSCEGDCTIATNSQLNPYNEGLLGNWRPYKSSIFSSTRKSKSSSSPSTAIYQDGTYNNFTSFLTSSMVLNTAGWTNAATMTKYDTRGRAIENKDALGFLSCEKYGHYDQLVVATAQNAGYEDVLFESFEDRSMASFNIKNKARCIDLFTNPDLEISSNRAHAGNNSLLIESGQVANIMTFYAKGANVETVEHLVHDFPNIKPHSDALFFPFRPLAGDYVFTCWMSLAEDPNLTYSQASIKVYKDGSTIPLSLGLQPTGERIDGWRKMTGKIPLIANSSYQIKISASSVGDVLIDDIKIQPHNSGMMCHVYDFRTLRLMASLDENHFATFYEYDDRGGLVRVKKETERGIQTIKEGRQHIRQQAN
jgi:hypothetical protein